MFIMSKCDFPQQKLTIFTVIILKNAPAALEIPSVLFNFYQCAGFLRGLAASHHFFTSTKIYLRCQNIDLGRPFQIVKWTLSDPQKIRENDCANIENQRISKPFQRPCVLTVENKADEAFAWANYNKLSRNVRKQSSVGGGNRFG